MTTTTRQGVPPGGVPNPDGSPVVWLDQEPLQQWRPPRTSLPIRLVVLVMVGVLLVAVVGVALAGGFNRRSDDRIDVNPGQLFESGPFQFVLTHAEVVAERDFEGELQSWRVIAYGSGAVTADKSSTFNSTWLALGRQGTGFSERGFVASVGAEDGINNMFQPGMPMLPVTITATLPPEFQPDDFVTVAVAKVEMVNLSASGSESGETWQASREYYLLNLPATVHRE